MANASFGLSLVFLGFTRDLRAALMLSRRWLPLSWAALRKSSKTYILYILQTDVSCYVPENDLELLTLVLLSLEYQDSSAAIIF